MSNTRPDTRVIVHKTTALDRIAPTASTASPIELDNILNSINFNAKPVFAVTKSNTLEVMISPGIDVDSETGFTKVTDPINGEMPDLTISRTVTFPASANGSNIVASTGATMPLVLAASQEVAVLVSIDGAGDLDIQIGTPDTYVTFASGDGSLALQGTNTPAVPANHRALAYVVVHTQSGSTTLVDITDADIYQLVDSNTPLDGTISDSNIAADADIARSKIAPGLANHVLINNGAGEVSSESQLAISRGGTGQATAIAGFDALSPTSAKGDLVCHDGATSITLSTGGASNNNRALVINDGASAGVGWVSTLTMDGASSNSFGYNVDNGPRLTGFADTRLYKSNGDLALFSTPAIGTRLYYPGITNPSNPALETTSTGITVYGHVVADSYISVGDRRGYQTANGSAFTGTSIYTYVMNPDGTIAMWGQDSDKTVLRFNGLDKLETTTSGISVTGNVNVTGVFVGNLNGTATNATNVNLTAYSGLNIAQNIPFGANATGNENLTTGALYFLPVTQAVSSLASGLGGLRTNGGTTTDTGFQVMDTAVLGPAFTGTSTEIHILHGNGELALYSEEDGETILYHNNSNRLSATSYGAKVRNSDSGGSAHGDTTLFIDTAAGDSHIEFMAGFSVGRTQGLTFSHRDAGVDTHNKGYVIYSMAGVTDTVTIGISSSDALYLGARQGGNRSIQFVDFNPGVDTALEVDGAGIVQLASSDETLKYDIDTFDKGLSVIKNIVPSKYKMLKDKENDPPYQYGFVAQQLVEAGLPEAAPYNEYSGYYNFTLKPIVGSLVNAVKEIEERLIALENS